MTAEGDNSVLLQKVVKDILTHTRSGKHPLPVIKKKTIRFLAESKNVSNFISLKTLVYLREQMEIKMLSTNLEDLVLN